MKRLLVAITIVIITLTCIVVLRSQKAGRIAAYYQAATNLIAEGKFEKASDELAKILKWSPKGPWANEARFAYAYSHLVLSGEVDKKIIAAHIEAIPQDEGGKLEYVALVIVVTLLIIFTVLGTMYVMKKTIKDRKAQQLAYYMDRIEKRIRASLKPSRETNDGKFDSVEDYRKYIEQYKKSEYSLMAECLICDYYLNIYSDSVKHIKHACETYQKFLTNFPGSVFGEEVQYKLANFYFFKLTEYTKAVEAYKNIIDKYHFSKWVKIAQSRINLIKDNLDYDYKPLSGYILAEKYYENKKYKNAVSEFQKIIDDYPDCSLADDAQYDIGDIYLFKLNESSKAIPEFQKILDNYPASKYAENAHYKIGECYRRMQKYTDATDVYKKFIRKYPKSNFLDYSYYYMGQCYEQLKQFSLAKKSYQKIIDDYPESIWVVVATSRLDVLKNITG